jgi:lambda repressor-like predicted transcriptional regulator
MIHQVSGARARDDLDMERALRRRVAGAPDVVRSTLSQKELKYNETTIDNLLGTPNKIVIPERYVPELVRNSCRL